MNTDELRNAIQDRRDGRDLAKDLINLIPSSLSQDAIRGVANHLREYADGVLGKQETELRVMGQLTSVVFESEIVNFGTHKGKTFGEAPIEYLTWLADQNNNLSAYLRSNRGRARIENGEK